jgi:hypothetical protein
MVQLATKRSNKLLHATRETRAREQWRYAAKGGRHER